MNVPNQLTVARIVMIFIFLFLSNVNANSWISETVSYTCHVSAYVLAILAGITDILDGYIARKYNMVTDFGRLIDPLADKIFIAATFIMLVEITIVPAWVAVVVISREFLVTGLRMLAINKGKVIPADKWGKLKTFLQMLMLLIGGASWIRLIPDLSSKTEGLFLIKIIWNVALWGIVVITVYSGAGYFYKHRSLFKDSW